MYTEALIKDCKIAFHERIPGVSYLTCFQAITDMNQKLFARLSRRLAAKRQAAPVPSDDSAHTEEASPPRAKRAKQEATGQSFWPQNKA